MPSLAYTDGLLALVCLWLLSRDGVPLGVRIATATLGIAAVLGVLRFSGLYPIPQWHQFVSMLGACAAFPLLAVSVLWPNAAVARQRKFAAVFFIILAVMANTMAMTARERLPEYATLKALGFSPGYVARLILGESLVIALAGGAIAIALTPPAAARIGEMTDTLFPSLVVSGHTVGAQALAALAVGLLAALVPMRRAARIRIVDGLRAVG